MKDQEYREIAFKNQFRYMGTVIFCVGLFYLLLVIETLLNKYFL